MRSQKGPNGLIDTDGLIGIRWGVLQAGVPLIEEMNDPRLRGAGRFCFVMAPVGLCGVGWGRSTFAAEGVSVGHPSKVLGRIITRGAVLGDKVQVNG